MIVEVGDTIQNWEGKDVIIHHAEVYKGKLILAGEFSRGQRFGCVLDEDAIPDRFVAMEGWSRAFITVNGERWAARALNAPLKTPWQEVVTLNRHWIDGQEAAQLASQQLTKAGSNL